MKIKIGNIFESNAKTLVNTINCVGVMGKGIALEFKKRYPEMYKEYVYMCNNNEIKPGEPYYYHNLCGVSIVNFPTKDHWRSPSKLSYIISGLDWFKRNYRELGITSVAFPPLGCGNGGLSWEIVGPLMYSQLKDVPIDVEIYAPYGTPPEQLTEQFLKKSEAVSSKEIIGEQRRKINSNWFLILYVIRKLNHDKYSLNVGRTIFQKICYLLTRTGVDTGFVFKRGSYGPYSKEVNKALMMLSNANFITEKQFGKMIETVVSDSFEFDASQFSDTDIINAEKVFDLLSRIKSTEQAEVIATILFSFDELIKKKHEVSEKDILKYVMSWKPHWNGREQYIQRNITGLSMLGWMKPVGLLDQSDDWLY